MPPAIPIVIFTMERVHKTHDLLAKLRAGPPLPRCERERNPDTYH